MNRSLRRLLAVPVAGAAALACVTALLLATGQAALVVTHGISMQPTYHQGDLVLVARGQVYAIGDAVAYTRPGHTGVVLHRITGGDPTGWVLQGDNNASADPTRPTQDQLVGRAALHVPGGGRWLARLTSPPALAASAFLLLAVGGGAATRRQRTRERRTMSPRHRRTQRTPLTALPPGLQTAAACVAALAVTGVALAALTWTRPTSTTVAEDVTETATMSFGYLATVPPSAAYDGTTVTAPQTVFRSLTDTVDVTWSWAGRAGTIAVDAELSTAGGWRSTQRLVPPLPLAAAQEGSVRLELTALQARAEAAAAVTGLPASSLTVTVVPTVTWPDGTTFAPRLPLQVTDAALTATDPLIATSETTVSRTRAVPAQLAALGRSVPVATARTAALVAVGLALLAAALVVGLARATGPVAEAERVRQRHKDLMLRVMPVAPTPGRPLVDVGDAEALVRIAQRYGLLVLHWERSGVTTYVVQDESTTYRYRVGAGQEAPAPVPS